jgi:hypothetical protein
MNRLENLLADTQLRLSGGLGIAMEIPESISCFPMTGGNSGPEGRSVVCAFSVKADVPRTKRANPRPLNHFARKLEHS